MEGGGAFCGMGGAEGRGQPQVLPHLCHYWWSEGGWGHGVELVGGRGRSILVFEVGGAGVEAGPDPQGGWGLEVEAELELQGRLRGCGLAEGAGQGLSAASSLAAVEGVWPIKGGVASPGGRVASRALCHHLGGIQGRGRAWRQEAGPGDRRRGLVGRGWGLRPRPLPRRSGT